MGLAVVPAARAAVSIALTPADTIVAGATRSISRSR